MGLPFVSYGLSTGTCPNYVKESVCESNTVFGAVASLCVGRNNCSVVQDAGKWGDPCNNVYKRLRLVAQCAPLNPKPSISPLPALPPSHSYECGTAPEWHQTTITCPAGSVHPNTDKSLKRRVIVLRPVADCRCDVFRWLSGFHLHRMACQRASVRTTRSTLTATLRRSCTLRPRAAWARRAAPSATRAS